MIPPTPSPIPRTPGEIHLHDLARRQLRPRQAVILSSTHTTGLRPPDALNRGSEYTGAPKRRKK